MIGRLLDYMSGFGEVRDSRGNFRAYDVLVNVEVGPTREFEAGGKMTVLWLGRAHAESRPDPGEQARIHSVPFANLAYGSDLVTATRAGSSSPTTW